jgi:hypothetical protein
MSRAPGNLLFFLYILQYSLATAFYLSCFPYMARHIIASDHQHFTSKQCSTSALLQSNKSLRKKQMPKSGRKNQPDEITV